MEELNNNQTEINVDAPEAPKAKVEKISLAELRAEANKMNAEENKFLEEQKRKEEERRQKQLEKEKAKNEEISKEIDDFFDSLMALSQEDRADFFKLIDEDIKNGGKK